MTLIEAIKTLTHDLTDATRIDDGATEYSPDGLRDEIESREDGGETGDFVVRAGGVYEVRPDGVVDSIATYKVRR